MKFSKFFVGLFTWLASFGAYTAAPVVTAPVVATISTSVVTTAVGTIATSLISSDADAQNVFTFLTKGDPGPSNNIAKVYIMAGQSNMDGQATSIGIDVQYTGALNPYIYSTYGFGTNIRGPSTQSWQRLELNKNNNTSGTNGVAAQNIFGPEIAFGKKMAGDHPDRILILKFAIPSSTMLGEGSTNDWMIGASGTNYQNLVQNTVINGLNAIVSQFGLVPEIRGFMWLQGEAERDGVSGYTTASDLQGGYTLQCSRMVQWLIDDIVEAGYDTRNMRVAFTRIKIGSPSTPTMYAAVRAAHVDLGTNFITNNPGYSRYCAGVTWIDTDALTQQDGIHFDQAGQIALGTAYYNYFSTYVNETVTIPSINTSGFDTDATLFINSAGLTDQNQGQAIHNLVASLKSGSLWNSYIAIYPFVGGNRKAHKVNLKDPTNLLGYNLTFNTGVKHTKAGFDGYLNGGFSTSNPNFGYADTHIPISVLGQNTAGFFYYTPTTTAEAAYGLGVSAISNTLKLELSGRWTDGKWYAANNGGETSGTAGADASGFYLNTRTSSTNFNVFIRTGTKTSVTSTSVTPDGTLFPIGGRSVSGTLGSFSIKTWAAFGLSNVSLTDTDVTNIQSYINTFQSATGVR